MIYKMKEKILPLAEPIINTYPIFSNPLSILMLHSETKGWIFNNFLQLCANGKALNFYDFNYKLCPYLKIQRLDKEWVKETQGDLIEFIKESILNDLYIYLIINRKYISAYKPSVEDKHDLFIHGVDTANEKFYIADNFEYGKYSKAVCTYDELRTALMNMNDTFEQKLGFNGCIEFMSYNKMEENKFCFSRVIDSFEDYYKGKPTCKWNVMEFRDEYEEHDWYFGIDCYHYLLESMEINSINNIGIQDYHLLWEHKKHILRVINYCKDNGYIKNTFSTQQMECIIKKCLEIRNLIIKSKISSRSDEKEKILMKIREIQEWERSFFEKLLESI